MADAPAGWYPNPANPSEEMYWQGTVWSNARRSVPNAPTDITAASTTLLAAPAALLAQTPSPMPPASSPITPGPKNKLGLWALVLGIIALVFAVVPGLSFIAFIPAIGAGVFGALGLLAKGKPHGKALSGTILGGVGLIVAISVSLATIAALPASQLAGADKPIPAAPESVPTKTAEPSATAKATQKPIATPKPSPATPPIAATPYGTYPANEAQFLNIFDGAKTAYVGAQTDLQRSQILANRATAMCALMTGGHVDNWVGKIHDIGANNDGFAYVEVEIAPSVAVQTWNNAFSDTGDNTLIKPEQAFFQTLVPMKTGTKITFSGDFLQESGSCLKKANLTETFYGIDPNFIFRFSNVVAQ